jgi:hypothetical protein
VKRRQQVLKLRVSLEIGLIAEAFALDKAGAALAGPHWQGHAGSAGVVERGKGTGRVAWEPEMFHSRPREREPAIRIAGLTMILAREGPSPPRERWKQRARSKED